MNRPALENFADKEYRDGYLQTQVRDGIAYQLQALREKDGMNQTEFAEATGKKQSVISRLENSYGTPSVQTLLDIACARNVALIVQFVSYPEFLDRTADMSPEALKPDTILESLASKRAEDASIQAIWRAMRPSVSHRPITKSTTKIMPVGLQHDEPMYATGVA